MSVSPRQKPRTSPQSRATIPLMVARESGLRASPGAFWRLCVANPELRLERTAKGEVVAMAPAGSDSSMRNLSVSSLLWIWNRETKLGVAFDSSAGFTLPNGAVRSPDASWITRERWNAVPPDDRMKFAKVCPDFVVELTSPTDALNVAREKMTEYIAQGVRLGWLLDPKSERVEIYRPDRSIQTLDRPATVAGEDVLPGFVLDLRGILFD